MTDKIKDFYICVLKYGYNNDKCFSFEDIKKNTGLADFYKKYFNFFND